MCECLKLLNEALESQNARMGITFSLNGKPSRIRLATEALEKRRGFHPATVLAEYCPICGVKYE